LIKKFRSLAKPLVIIICVTFIAGALYIGGMSFFGGNDASAAVATVNGRPISAYDLQNAYLQEVQYYQMIYGQLNNSMLEGIRYNAYEILVNNSLVEEELDNRKYKPAAADVDAEVAAMKEMYGQEVLDMYGYNDAALKQIASQQLAFQQLLNDIAGEIEISEQEIKQQYEQVRASHILVRVDGDDPELWEAAEARAEEILEMIQIMDFAEAARNYSDDGSAENGGDLGFFSRGQMVEPFEEAAFALDVGEVSGLVKSQFGYHIIKVTDKKTAEGDEFEAAKDEIREELVEEEKFRRFSEWLTERKNNAKIVVIDRQLAAYQALLNNEYEEAIKAYHEAIEENPANGFLYASIGQVYLQLDQTDKAIEAYEKALEHSANDGQLHLMLGSLYQDTEQNDKAIAAYLKASELSSGDIMTQLIVRSMLTELEAEEAVAAVDERIAALQEMYAQIEAEESTDTTEDIEPNEQEQNGEETE